MSRPIPSLHLVGDPGSRPAHAVLAASEAAQPGRAVRHSPDLATATMASIGEGREVIVLLAGQSEDFKAALAALDPRGLPRWAVVPSSFEEAQLPEFAGGEWSAATLAHSIRFAVNTLALRRENARLQGDLKTIGRRLTHDLRTPLNSISTANEALCDPVIATDSASFLHRSVSSAVNEAGSLLNRISPVFMASARPIEFQPVDMEEVVWSVRQRLDTRVRAAGATIISCEKWPVVTGVPELLELVWTNLIVNSLEHAGPAPRIEIGWRRLPAATCFWVRDSGPGVAVAKRARLFYPFDRLNDLNAPRGYGLSFVQRLVELQSGTTGYDADPLPGGTFFFTLPTSHSPLPATV